MPSINRNKYLLFKTVHEKHRTAKTNTTSFMQDYSEKYLLPKLINNVNGISFKKNEIILRYKVPLI